MTEAPRICDDVRPLTPTEAAGLLARMALDHGGPPDLATLERVQWAFLRASPFHNLELLAGCSPRTPDAAIDAVLAGRGGPCHVQAIGFLALIRALGFDAHLAAATIGEPGDHMVVIARVGCARWVCDVGNGHPYRRPFPLDGRRIMDHVGWRFEAVGDGAGLTLRRHFADGRSKVVYRVDPRRRAFADFEGIIDGHHGTAGFGPFLTGIRAVRIDDDRLITLRDAELRRCSVAGDRRRCVPDLSTAGRVLTRVFGFEEALVDAALARVAPHAHRWPAMARRPLHIAITVASDRPDALAALLDDLSRDAERCDRAAVAPPTVHVLANGSADRIDAVIERACASGLDVRSIVDDGAPTGPRTIAESRRAQVRALARALSAGEAIDAVWMLDDDLRLARLDRIGGRLAQSDGGCYLDAIADRWWRCPEASILVGGVTGDPPIRPDAVLATQLLDLRANLDRFMALPPDEIYRAPDQAGAFALPDFYYDHARGDAHVDQPFYWLARTDGISVRETALRFVEAMGHIFAGRTPTRPLTGAGGVPAGEPWLRRGGNAVFLDIDSALRHPYPTLAIDDGATRRADMVGTAIVHGEGGARAVGWDRSLRHVRRPAPPGEPEARREALRRSLVNEFFGVLLARATVEGEQDLRGCARRRARRIVERFALGAERLRAAQVAIGRARAGWMGRDTRLLDALSRLEDELRDGQRVYFGGEEGLEPWLKRIAGWLDRPDVLDRLEALVRSELPARVAAERRAVAAIFDPGARPAPASALRRASQR